MIPLALTWGTPGLIGTNGRLHITCNQNPGHQYWLTCRELAWSVCAHCSGWWTYR